MYLFGLWTYVKIIVGTLFPSDTLYPSNTLYPE